MQSAEVGHFSLNINNKTFNLVASLRNMAKLANAVELIEIYETLHDRFMSDWMRISVARQVLLACSDNPGIDEYLIKCNNMKPHLNNNQISINDQVMVAAALMRHGIAGVNRPKYAGSDKKSKAADRFDVNSIVADAMIHFGLSKAEALDLTMSEFCHLLAAKFPPESSKNDTPSLDDHKAAMKALMEKNNNGK
jgi:hypothetical protein